MSTDTVLTTQKEFSDSQTLDLTDEEIKNCFMVLLPLVNRWRAKYGPKFSEPNFTMDEFERAIDALDDEIKTRFFDMGIIATVDPTPIILEGKGPTVEFVGKLPKIAALGLDHDQKTWEVQKAKLTGEDYLGQNEVKKL